ncbi:MAG: S-layer homology domain-containing protein [Clostridia bacterium]|nr:S-layer homology domain-containing protein [Clostridia bacterium]
MFKKSLSLLLCLLLVFSSTVALAADGDAEQQYSITLLTLGGGVVQASQSWATPGTQVTIMASPHTGYVFYSWATSDVVLGNAANYVTGFIMPAQNVTITANFVENASLGGITGGNSGTAMGDDYTDVPAGATTYMIFFDTQGGSPVADIEVEEGKTANPPTPPTLDGYIFNGWTTDPAGKVPFDFATTKMYKSLTVYAQWIPASSAERFTDLGNHTWARDAIYNLVLKGIITGTSATTYSPAKNISRADFITLVVRAFGFKVGFSENFADVKSGTYYYNAVGIAKELGIATGVGTDKFNPTAPITRQDIMVIIARATEKAGITLKPLSYPAFDDMNFVSAYAIDAVNLLTRAEVITGAGGKINPKNYATRAEVAVILDRLLNK